MQATSQHEIICPNCGEAAEGNYCANCGQKNQIRRDTFLDLLGNFLAHIFDYESKSWQTLRTLWLKPGALTTAYMRNQRVRYVAPVSLYIFISSAFFIVTFLSPRGISDSINFNFSFGDQQNMTKEEIAREYKETEPEKHKSFGHFIHYKALKFSLENPDTSKSIQEQFVQSFVKIMFFMIPIMALILKVFFSRNKSLLFVDHAVFSLHYHSFWFSAMLFYYLYPSTSTADYFLYLLLAITLVYLFLAISNVYHTGWFRSVIYTILIAAIYTTMLVFVATGYVFLIVVLA